jgi:hypothetical protein
VRRATDAPTLASGSERTAYQLRGLSNSRHTVTLTTSNDAAFNVDAVGILAGVTPGRRW